MSDEHDGGGNAPRRKPLQSVASFVGGAWGGLSIAVGLLMLTMGSEASQRVIGLAAVCAGLLLIPPVVRRIRQRVAFMRRPGMPTFASLVVGVAILTQTPASNAGWETVQPGETLRSGSRNEPAAPAPAELGERVDIVAVGDPLRPAQDALNRGSIADAVLAFFSADVPQARRVSPEGRRLRDAIQSASDRSAGLEDGEREAQGFIAARASLEALGNLAPTATVGEVWRRLTALEDAARVLEEHPEDGLPENAIGERRRLRTTLTQRQQADFPAMREAYGETMRRNLWEQDVEVRVTGERATIIDYVGVVFASNRNIAQVQRGAVPHLQKLRFAQSQYRWSTADARRTTYDLDATDDGTVGYWQGGRFAEVR